MAKQSGTPLGPYCLVTGFRSVTVASEALVKLGATRQEVEETLGMAVYMGGGPSLMYAADAIAGAASDHIE